MVNDSPALQLDRDKCTHCHACISECPIARFHGYRDIDEVREAECLLCGHCLAVCQHGAITHAEVTTTSTCASALSVEQILHMLNQRRSIRHFQQKPVFHADWDILLAALRSAPTGMNSRSVQATIITDKAILAEISTQTANFCGLLMRIVQNPFGRMALSIAAGKTNVVRLHSAASELKALYMNRQAGGDPILHHAPGIMVLHADRIHPTGSDDCLLAAMAAMLAAPGVGLGTCMIGFAVEAFQRLKALRALIELPKNHDVAAILAVGYPATPYQRIPSRPAIPVRWL